METFKLHSEYQPTGDQPRQWKFGSRKKAYQEASKASYNIVFNENEDDYVMKQKIREYTDEDTRKDYIIDILIDMPDVETEIGEWVKNFSNVFCLGCSKYGHGISTDKKLKDVFKIKQSDKKILNFKQIPLRKYLKKKTEDKYTLCSNH